MQALVQRVLLLDRQTERNMLFISMACSFLLRHLVRLFRAIRLHSRVTSQTVTDLKDILLNLNSLHPDSQWLNRFQKTGQHQVTAKAVLFEGKLESFWAGQKSNLLTLSYQTNVHAVTLGSRKSVTELENKRERSRQYSQSGDYGLKSLQPAIRKKYVQETEQDYSAKYSPESNPIGQISFLGNMLQTALAYKPLGRNTNYFLREHSLAISNHSYLTFLGDVTFDFRTQTLTVQNTQYIASNRAQISQALGTLVMKHLGLVCLAAALSFGLAWLHLTSRKRAQLLLDETHLQQNLLSSHPKVSPLLANDSSMLDNQKCSLCYDAFREIIFLPCKHFNVCFTCYQGLLQSHISRYRDDQSPPLECPYCKQTIQHQLYIVTH